MALIREALRSWCDRLAKSDFGGLFARLAVWFRSDETQAKLERLRALAVEGLRRTRAFLMRVRMWQWTVLYGTFIVASVLWVDTTAPRPGDILYWPFHWFYGIPELDKVGHFVLFGILALLINLTAFEARPRRSIIGTALLCSLSLAALISLEELSQIWLPRRDPSITSLTSSLLGVAVFTWLAMWIWRRRSGMAKAHLPLVLQHKKPRASSARRGR
jgi:VanZ family protein